MAFGGLGLQTSTGYMMRTYSGFGSHTMVYFSVGVFLMGTWNPGDTFSIQFDDKNPTPFTIKAPTNVNFHCGSSNIDTFFIYIVGKTLHTTSSITIKISWNTVTPSLGIGLRECTMSFGTQKSGEVEGAYVQNTDAIYPNTGCGNQAYPSGQTCYACQGLCRNCYGPNPNQCYSPTFGGSYYDGNQVKLCPSTCRMCSGSSSNQCTLCNQNWYLDSGNICSSNGCTSPLVSFGPSGAATCLQPCSSGNFLLYDNTCVSACDPPLVLGLALPSAQTCESPCGQTANQYLYWDGSCQPACPYYSRTNSGYYFCDACQPGYYMYSNKTCSSLCYPAFKQRTQGGSKFCDYPCDSTLYLYQDGSCLSTCYDVFDRKVEGNFRFCNYPCQTNEFLYQDKSCSQKCSAPFTKSVENGYSFCNAPCSATTFFYEDGSCRPTCISGFIQKVEGIVQYCNYPCSSSEFLYQDGSCRSTCQTPFVLATQGSFRFCNFICTDATNYYYQVDGTCRSGCEYPYSIINQVSCAIILSEGDVHQVTAVSGISNSTTQAVGATSVAVSVLTSSDPTSFFLKALSSMLLSVRYMRIGYPPKLQAVFSKNTMTDSSIAFIDKIHTTIKASSTKYPLPDNFEQYKFHSSFLVNFWESLVSIVFLLCLIILITILTKCTKRWKRVNALFSKLQDIVKWNFFFTYYMSFYGDIVLFTSFELRTIRLDSVVAVMSVLILMLINALPILMFIKTLHIVSYLEQETVEVHERMRRQNLIEFNKKWKSYLVIYDTFRASYWSQRAFFFIYSFRLYLFYCIISYMHTQPLAQAILISLINIGMIVYLIWRYPIKNPIKLLQNVVQEIVLMIVNGCIVTLAIFDTAKIGNDEARKTIGDVIMYCSIVFSWLGLVFLLITAIFSLITHFMNQRYKKQRAVFLLQRADLRKPREPRETLSQKLQQRQNEELEDLSVLVNLDPDQSSSLPPAPKPTIQRTISNNSIINKPANSLVAEKNVIQDNTRPLVRSPIFKKEKTRLIFDPVVESKIEQKKKGNKKAINGNRVQLDEKKEKPKLNERRIRSRKNKANNEVKDEKPTESQIFQQKQNEEHGDLSVLSHLNPDQSSSPLFRLATANNLTANRPANSLMAQENVIARLNGDETTVQLDEKRELPRLNEMRMKRREVTSNTKAKDEKHIES